MSVTILQPKSFMEIRSYPLHFCQAYVYDKIDGFSRTSGIYANEDSCLYCISKKGLKVLPFFSGDWGGCCGRTIAVLVSLSEGLDLPLKASKVSAVSKTISSDNCWSLHNDMF